MEHVRNFATFDSLQGTRFSVALAPEVTLEFTLVSATNLDTGSQALGPQAARWERFSLIFRGPRSRLVPQATYDFTHAALGTFPMFIVPIGVDDDGYRYEAAFNRRLEQGPTTP